MPRSVALRPSAVVASALAILLCGSAAARAQAVDAGFDPGANQIVNSIAVQPDGKTIVGGSFTALGGITGTTVRNHIGRLNADGTVDAGFNPGTDGPVLAVAVQADGKILAGGATGLTSARSHIARFNADGTVDTGFNPGVSGNVWALAVQPDGTILVGGEFTTLSGTPRNALGRLNDSGSIDPAFNPNVTKTLGNPIVYTLLVQPDGKIVIGGYFNGIGGGMRNFLGRVDTNGVVDTFTPTVTSISGVNALALQADGKIVVGGTWTFYTLDLNGDGRDDFFLYNRVNGTWVEAFSQAGFGGFDYPATGQWDPGWQVTAADLNGDRRTDLFLLNAAGVHVSALSAATGGFNYVAGAPWTPGWSVAPGDLNNDGNADLFLYNAANGVWAEAFSDGAGDFTYATGVWDPGWSVTMTDFNADGSGDLLLSRADGTWVQAINVGAGTFNYVAGTWGSGWTVYARLGNR